MKKNLILVALGLIMTGCIDLNIITGIPDDKDYLRNSQNGLVKDCNGGHLMKNSIFTTKFWEENNLPKGTTEFVCVKGKAYLPGKEPK